MHGQQLHRVGLRRRGHPQRAPLQRAHEVVGRRVAGAVQGQRQRRAAASIASSAATRRSRRHRGGHALALRRPRRRCGRAGRAGAARTPPHASAATGPRRGAAPGSADPPAAGPATSRRRSRARPRQQHQIVVARTEERRAQRMRERERMLAATPARRGRRRGRAPRIASSNAKSSAAACGRCSAASAGRDQAERLALAAQHVDLARLPAAAGEQVAHRGGDVPRLGLAQPALRRRRAATVRLSRQAVESSGSSVPPRRRAAGRGCLGSAKTPACASGSISVVCRRKPAKSPARCASSNTPLMAASTCGRVAPRVVAGEMAALEPVGDELARRLEDARLGATEAVDALLRVADDEDRRRPLAAGPTARAGVAPTARPAAPATAAGWCPGTRRSGRGGCAHRGVPAPSRIASRRAATPARSVPGRPCRPGRGRACTRRPRAADARQPHHPQVLLMTGLLMAGALDSSRAASSAAATPGASMPLARLALLRVERGAGARRSAPAARRHPAAAASSSPWRRHVPPLSARIATVAARSSVATAGASTRSAGWRVDGVAGQCRCAGGTLDSSVPAASASSSSTRLSHAALEPAPRLAAAAVADQRLEVGARAPHRPAPRHGNAAGSPASARTGRRRSPSRRAGRAASAGRSARRATTARTRHGRCGSRPADRRRALLVQAAEQRRERCARAASSSPRARSSALRARRRTARAQKRAAIPAGACASPRRLARERDGQDLVRLGAFEQAPAGCARPASRSCPRRRRPRR